MSRAGFRDLGAAGKLCLYFLIFFILILCMLLLAMVEEVLKTVFLSRDDSYSTVKILNVLHSHLYSKVASDR